MMKVKLKIELKMRIHSNNNNTKKKKNEFKKALLKHWYWLLLCIIYAELMMESATFYIIPLFGFISLLRARITHVYLGKILGCRDISRASIFQLLSCISFMSHQTQLCWDSGKQSRWLFLPPEVNYIPYIIAEL